MQRLRGERGAVSTVVALLMVPLIGFAAISVDIAGLWVQLERVHNVADAAALAVAQDCAAGSTRCSAAAQTAQSMAAANVGAGTPSTAVTVGSGRVDVVATSTKTFLFAPVLKMRSKQVSARATVQYGSPTGGVAVLPLVFSWCEWKYQTSGGVPTGTTPQVIYLTKTAGATQCTGPSNNIVPGGFGWLTVSSGTCGTKTSIANTVMSDPGNSVPSGCTTDNFSSSVGKTVLLPVFDSSSGTGSGASYRIFGYAAFQLTGYHFGGQYDAGTGTCNGNARCIKGYFLQFVDLSDAFTYGTGAPQLGVSVLKLTA